MRTIMQIKGRTIYCSSLVNSSFVLAVLFLCSFTLNAAVLDITDDILSYTSLTDTTVNMNGVSELHITDANDPIPGCVINLNSIDSYFILENINPSVVASNYLNQIYVSGAAAVLDTNVRVVQYAAGAVVIPQSSTFQPLQVFTEEGFLGASVYLSQYTQYDAESLGMMASTISSFILKRGYTATFAQNSNGSGYSINYVAQDCDLEIGALPDELKDKINFVRVFPWRWVSKKGIGGNIGTNLDIKWWYNWNIDQNSTLDKEYVPIRWGRWWPGLDQDWQARGSSHLLGYNEPDSADQSNIAVGDAIWSWPDLLWTGLRVGSPAPTDGGRSWLYDFINQADAADLRVDFVAVHYYWCYNPADPSGAATQMYNYLKDVYDNTGRPIWITEWNNGANWTGCGDPTYEQQAACIGAMIDMLDSTPFVERYAIYNWVEDCRRVEWDDGWPTQAGEVYRDQVSPIGYLQVAYDTGNSSNAIYYFDDNFRDSSGYGNNPQVRGAMKRTTGQLGNAAVLDGVDDYLVLPTNMGQGDDFTFAAWVYWDGGSQWQRIFDFGADENKYMFITPNSASNTLRFAITTSGYGSEQRLESGAFPVGTWTHVAVTLEGNTGRLYVNGTEDTSGTITLNPSDLNAVNNFLGESQFASDPLFDGMLDEVFIADYALNSTQIAAMLDNNPPEFATDTIDGGSVLMDQPYSGSIAGQASDPDVGDVLTYSKLTGPDWLVVATDGSLTGTPDFTDVGLNSFVVSVSDGLNGCDQAVLEITVASVDSMVIHYPFEGNTNDVVGSHNGTAIGSPAYITGYIGQAIDLDGTDDYITLPTDIGNMDDCTIAGWFKWDGGSQWQRIFDFGNGTSQYMFLSPGSGSSTLRFAITSGSGEQIVETTQMATGTWIHVAVTLEGDLGTLYVGGSPVATNSAMTVNPSDFDTVTNYIGDSQFSADPLFDGAVDDFRIYNYALSETEVADLVAGGDDTTPPAAPTNLTASGSDSQVSLNWDDNTELDLASYSVYRSTTGGSGYASIATGVTTSDYVDNSVTNGTPYYYVVTAVDTSSNESVYSNEASATPDVVSDIIDTANADIAVQGSVSGSYTDTQASDNGYESITEVRQGNPSKGFSSLEHKWTINVTGGTAVTFYIEAYQTASSDGDNFIFSYSTDDSTYTDMLTVTKTGDNDTYQSYAMPASLSGTVYIRVVDTDSGTGNQAMDTLYVDHLYILSAGGEPDTTPPSPDPMTWATVPYSTGSTSIAMVATTAFDPSGVEYYFTCTSGGGHDSGWQSSPSYEDTGLSPETSYTYTVKARDLSSNLNETAVSTAESATTDPAGAEPDMYVNDIAMAYKSAGPNYNGQATVWIKDDTGANVEGAVVYGDWSGATTESVSGTTLADGTVFFESSKVKNGGTFTFTVTDVVKSGYIYNAALNVETSDSITAP